MKTDLERFIELYKSFGIDLKVTEEIFRGDYYITPEMHYQVVIGYDDRGEYTPMNKKFDGYHGFCSDIIFDKEGKFIKQGFWE